MEITIDKKEFQKISMQFRRYSSRLLTTSVDDGIDNLKRLLNYIENTPLIWDFIDESNKKEFDIESEVKNRDYFEGYNIPLDMSDEIAFTYQLLKYCTENCSEYWGICMYYNTSSNHVQDSVDEFSKSVVHPFISHIEGYLKERWIDMGEEGKIQITVNGGQVAIAQDNATVNATQINNFGDKEDLIKYIQQYKELLNKLDIDKDMKEETEELLDAALDETNSDKPKKSIIKMAITKVGEVVKVGSTVVGMVKLTQQIIELFNKFI